MYTPVFYALNDTVDDAPFLSTKKVFSDTGRNTGNLAFTYATRRLLGTSVTSFNWSGSHKKSDDELLVVSCAISEMPEVPQGTITWYDAMASRAVSSHPNIALRGEHTYEYLKSIGREKSAVVLGCPSNLISPFRDLGRRIKDREVFPPKRVAVAAGSPWNPKHRLLERTLADMVTQTGGSYITQMTLEMVQLARADFSSMDRDVLLKYKNFLRPNMVVPEFMQWCRQYMEMFTHVPSWMEHLRKFDFVVGNRIHGVMLALQAGVPAMCIAHDSRIVELCETMCIPYVHMEKVTQHGLNIYDLRHYYNFDADSYDKNRVELASRFNEFFRNNKVNHSDMLESLM